MKKRLSIVSMLVMVFTMISLVSCSKEETISGGGISTSFQVSKSALQFSKTGGETYLYVESPTQPVVLSDQSWLVVSQDLSNSARVYKYKVAAATNTDTNDRTASISVSSGSEQVTVPVNQVSTEGLIIETASFEVSADGGSITVKLKANGEYDVTTPSWIAQADNSTRANMQDYEEVFTIEANISPLARTAQISFTRGDIVESVTVNQAAGQVEANMDRTAKELAKAMYPGWNLGNTMEASFSDKDGLKAETSWQKTKTTQEVIDAVAASGFKAVRIPCSWMIHADAGGTIDEKWMARVKQVVNYCISKGLYVVLNDHYDGGWIEVLGFSKNLDSYAVAKESRILDHINALKDLWTQIATAFKDYDEHLLFAGLNEPFQNYDLFNGRHEELTPILLRYNAAFVEAVRATGGNNANRILVVQGPSTSIDSSVQYMTTDKLPEEAGRLMVEVHFYDPGQFCGTFDATGNSAFYYWGAGNHAADHNANWGEEGYMQDQFTKLKTAYTSQGYPVIIGEYAGLQRTLGDGQDQEKHNASVKLFYQCVNQYAVNNGIVPFAWDTNDPSGLLTEGGSTTIIDRAKCSVVGTNAMAGVLAGAAAGQWPN